MTSKAKKSSKKPKINLDNIERYLMIVLLVAFILSAAVLLFRSNNNIKPEVGDPVPVIEQSKQ